MQRYIVDNPTGKTTIGRQIVDNPPGGTTIGGPIVIDTLKRNGPGRKKVAGRKISNFFLIKELKFFFSYGKKAFPVKPPMEKLTAFLLARRSML